MVTKGTRQSTNCHCSVGGAPAGSYQMEKFYDGERRVRS